MLIHQALELTTSSSDCQLEHVKIQKNSAPAWDGTKKIEYIQSTDNNIMEAVVKIGADYISYNNW